MSSSCAAHEISVSFCKILFTEPPWACQVRVRTNNDIIMKLMRTRDSDRWQTSLSIKQPYFPCLGSSQIGAFSVIFSLLAIFSRITRLFVRLVPMLSGTKESVSSPEKYYWENIQRERDRKNNIWMTKNINVPLLATRAGRSVISSTSQMIRVLCKKIWGR